MERLPSGLQGTDVSPQQISVLGSIAYRLDTTSDQPVLLVSYVPDEHPFATFLNEDLARRIRTALAEGINEVVTSLLTEIEIQRRLTETVEESLHTTFQVDEARIAKLVEEYFNRLRGELATKATEKDATATPMTSSPVV